MRIYLAARYSRRDELCRCRDALAMLGHVVTSRWLNGDHQVDDQGLSREAQAEERERFAREDLEDLSGADLCISFTEPPRSTSSRGGRHVEFGFALGHGIECWVVGPRENVFHCLPQVSVLPSFEAVLEVLAGNPSNTR